MTDHDPWAAHMADAIKTVQSRQTGPQPGEEVYMTRALGSPPAGGRVPLHFNPDGSAMTLDEAMEHEKELAATKEAAEAEEQEQKKREADAAAESKELHDAEEAQHRAERWAALEKRKDALKASSTKSAAADALLSLLRDTTGIDVAKVMERSNVMRAARLVTLSEEMKSLVADVRKSAADGGVDAETGYRMQSCLAEINELAAQMTGDGEPDTDSGPDKDAADMGPAEIATPARTT